MAFRIRDLMIKVVKDAGCDGASEAQCTCTIATLRDEPPGGAVHPLQGTPCTCTIASVYGGAQGAAAPAAGVEAQCTCTIATVGVEPDPNPGTLVTITTVTTVTTVTTIVQGGGRGRGVDLKHLKEQLREALEQLDKHEGGHPKGDRMPGTVEESVDLERRLEGAIEELRDHRKNLEKPEPPAPKPPKSKSKGKK